MGFGTLFFGYFLLLNITYYQFTDVIAALVMLYALYKLSSVSSYFKRPMYASILFSVFGLIELPLGLMNMFFPGDTLTTVVSLTSIIRAIIICLYTVLLLRAMGEIARSLEVERIPTRCRTMTVWTMVLYMSEILFESSILNPILPKEAISVIYIAIILGLLILPIVNLTIIYGCYMRICLPKDLDPKPKPSRFAFINEFRRRREEKRKREEEEYRRRLEEKRRRRKK